MIVSNTNIIQFWDIAQRTYNESSIAFIRRPCYFHPFQTSDDFNLDVIPDAGINAVLKGYNRDGTLWQSFPLTQIGTGSHVGVDFNWSSYPEVVNSMIRFFIENQEVYTNGNFESGALAPWTQPADTGVGAWVANVTGGDKSASLSIAFAGVSGTTRTSIALRHTYNQINATAKTFQYKVVAAAQAASSGTWGTGQMGIVYYKAGIQVGTQNLGNITSSTTHAGTFVTSITDFDTIGFRIVYNYTSPFNSFVGTWRIDLCDLEPVSLESVEKKKSDSVSIKELQNYGQTTLIEYSNTKDFDDKDFTSTGAVFKIRIPGIFYQASDVMTEENLTLSDGAIVTLRNDITPKRLLEVGFVPDYIHTKICKILMHDINEITLETGERTSWKKMDDYVKQPLTRYRQCMATCLLTQKQTVLVNIGGDAGNTVLVEGKIYGYQYDATYQ